MNLNKNVIYNNALRTIAFNEQISKQIDDVLGKLDREINSQEDKFDYILSHIDLNDQSNSYCEAENNQNIRRITNPYFTDHIGLIPFNNEIEKNRIEYGCLDHYNIKSKLHKLCAEKNFEILKDSVIRNIVDIESYRLRQSKDRSSSKKLNDLIRDSETKRESLLKRCDDSLLDKIDWLYVSTNDLKGQISPENCRRFCDNFFNSKFDDSKFSEEENNELLELVNEFGSQGNWHLISERLTTKRRSYICFKQWSDLIKKIETSEEWSKEEDEFLCETIKTVYDDLSSESINWKGIALLIPNRSGRDCERRWNSINCTITVRPFTSTEDYEMLKLIKRIGTDDWNNIASEMDHRTVEECQRRYCSIVDELCEWSYTDDRRLWLVLLKYFREKKKESDELVVPTTDLAKYRSVMKIFNGRDSVVIRYRYAKLCKWFHLWNQFYMQVNETKIQKGVKVISFLTECPKEKEIVMNDIQQILKDSSYFSLVRECLSSIGTINPDKVAHELIMSARQGNSGPINDLIRETKNKKMINFILAMRDIKSGIFIPLKFDDYHDRSESGMKFPERNGDNLRIQNSSIKEFESKVALSKTIMNELKEVMQRNRKISDVDKQCISKLITCDGTFTSALNYAIASLELKMINKVDIILKKLPDLLERMMDYVYAQQHQEPSVKTIRIKSSANVDNKRKQIAELLMYREFIPQIHKTHLSSAKREGCQVTKYLPRSVSSNLITERSIKSCSRNISASVAKLLKFPELDSKIRFPGKDFDDSIMNINLQTPDRLKFNLLRGLFLQQPELLRTGSEQFVSMMNMRYDNPIDSLNRSENSQQKHFSIDKSCVHLEDARFKLLKSRLLSILATTSVAARISPTACAISGDRLHGEQNDIPCSTMISQSFDVVESIADLDSQKKSKKRKILESLDDNSESLNFVAGCQYPVELRRDKPLTRRNARFWTKISVTESDRSFFVPKSIFDFMSKNQFAIESINGVKVEDFME